MERNQPYENTYVSGITIDGHWTPLHPVNFHVCPGPRTVHYGELELLQFSTYGHKLNDVVSFFSR